MSTAIMDRKVTYVLLYLISLDETMPQQLIEIIHISLRLGDETAHFVVEIN